MSITAIATELSADVASGHAILVDYVAATDTISASDWNTTNNTVDLSGMTPAPVVDTIVYFSNLDVTTDIQNSTAYLVESVASGVCTLKADPAGSAIDITTNPITSGTATASDAAPRATVGGELVSCVSVADAVRHEVLSYGSINGGNRPTYTPPGSVTYYTKANGNQRTDASGNAIAQSAWAVGFSQADSTIDLDTSVDVPHTHVVPITGGSATRLNTTGTVQGSFPATGDTANPQTAASGAVGNLPVSRALE